MRPYKALLGSVAVAVAVTDIRLTSLIRPIRLYKLIRLHKPYKALIENIRKYLKNCVHRLNYVCIRSYKAS